MPNNYLEQSARTCANPPVVAPKEYWTNNTSFLFSLMEVVAAGVVADGMKRGIFYKTPLKDTNKRILETTAENGDMFERLIHMAEENEFRELSPEQMNLIHACLGMMSEASELFMAVIKSYVENKDLDVVNVREELGDLMWYQALGIRQIGETFESVGAINIKKLAARYPDKFTTEEAVNRDLDNERQVLETN